MIMTDQEIDRWVEEHVTAPEDSDIKPAVVEWGKVVAHKFYKLGKLDEYNRLHQTKA